MVQAAASKNRQAVHKASETAEAGELPSGVKSCILWQAFPLCSWRPAGWFWRGMWTPEPTPRTRRRGRCPSLRGVTGHRRARPPATPVSAAPAQPCWDRARWPCWDRTRWLCCSPCLGYKPHNFLAASVLQLCLNCTHLSVCSAMACGHPVPPGFDDDTIYSFILVKEAALPV